MELFFQQRKNASLISCKVHSLKQSYRDCFDRSVKLQWRTSLEDYERLLNQLEEQGWLLGEKGECYAKDNFIIFTLYLNHLR